MSRGAIESFESSLVLYPDDAWIHYFLGACLASYGGTGSSPKEKSLRCFERAFDVDPTDKSIALELNLFYSKRGVIESCKRLATQAVKRTQGHSGHYIKTMVGVE